MRKRFLALLLALICPFLWSFSSEAEAATYYVSPKGNDNTGNGSSGKPWSSLSKACSVAKAQGDVIRVAAGKYTDNRNCVLEPGVSIEGAGKSSTTITTSCTGYYISAVSPAMTAGNNTISGITFRGGTSLSTRQGDGCIRFQRRHNSVVRDCDIMYFESPTAGEGNAVEFLGDVNWDVDNTAPPEIWMDGCKLYNCRIIGCHRDNIYRAAVTVLGLSNLEIHDNVFDETGTAGFCLKGSPGWLKGARIYRNTFTVDPYAVSRTERLNVELWNICADSDISGNTFTNGYISFVSGQTLGGSTTLVFHDNVVTNGIKSEFSVSDHRAYRNRFIHPGHTENDMGSGIGFWTSHGSAARGLRNIQWSYNEFVDMYGEAIVIEDKLDEDGTGPVPMILDGLEIFNNVFAGLTLHGSYSAGIAIYPAVGSSAFNGIRLVNNIFTDMGRGILCTGNTNLVSGEISNNVFYLVGTNVVPEDLPGMPLADNLSNTNPLFVDQTAGDYTLLPGSPCIDVGKDMGYAYFPKYGPAYDIGAHEFVPVGAPVAYAGDDRVVTAGLIVTLDGSGSYDGENDPLTYRWTQVQGPTVILSDPTAAAPVFTAPAVATPQVLIFQLTVSDGLHTSFPSLVSVTVNPVIQPPVANFSGSPVTGIAPLTVRFTDLSVGTISGWSWDFGDSSTSREQNPVHVYSSPGSYSVRLTVTGPGGESTRTLTEYVHVEAPQPGDYLITVDATSHQRFGLYYPVTYGFRLPAGSSGLTAQYRYSGGGVWNTLPVKTGSDAFNGIDAVRFDYGAGMAYVSIAFSRASDSVYLRFLNAAGQPVHLVFESIPRFYDNRKAAVTVSLDDWADWNDVYFRTAADFLGQLGLHFTVGITTSNTVWSSIQQKIDQYGPLMEVASHSAFHSCSASEYTANGYEAEVIGSRDAIIKNLSYPAHPYVPLFIEPCGYTDSVLQSWITSGNYLLSRSTGWNADLVFAPWNDAAGRYGRAAVAYDDYGNSDDPTLLAQANAAFDRVLAAGGVYQLMDHPWKGFWHQGSYLLQHLDYIRGRSNVWYVPVGQLYQYHFLQEMRGHLTVQPVGSTAPVANFTAAPTVGVAPLNVAFTDSSSGAITNWQWDFGDGLSATEQNSVHVYSTPGSYTVRLTVSGPGGSNTLTQPNYVQVVPKVNPSVTITSPRSGDTFSAPGTIAITANATAGSGATVSRIEFYSGSTLLGSATSSPYGYTWSNVPAGNYSLTAKVIDSLGGTAISTPVTVTVTGTGLPAPWSTTDVGSVGVAGSAGYLGGVFSVSGAGADIWGTSDGFRYVYQRLTGNGEIVARVSSQQNTNQWAKAGVMIRETLAANSRHALMAITPLNGAAFQRRVTAGDVSLHTQGAYVAAPYWVKLVRSGTVFSGYISTDGVAWTLVGSATITMTNDVYVGLAVTSHDTTVASASTFTGVTVTGAPVTAPTVALTKPAPGDTFTAPATIAFAATATAGSGATVSRVEYYNGSALLGSAASSPYSYTWSNVPAGNYSLTAKVIDTLGGTAVSTPVAVTVTGTSLPAPWSTTDIGSVGAAGNAGYLGGVFSVSGAGADIWGTADGFRYVYQPLTGNGEIVARVSSQQNTNQWAKAGVMIRETLTANSRHALMAITPLNGAAFQRRVTTGDVSLHTQGAYVAAPYWVKLVRSGTVFSGYISADGVAWTLVGSATIAMGNNVYVGLAVTSHDTTVASASTFTGVTVTGAPVTAPTVALTKPAPGDTFTAPATIAFAATATTGSGATVSRVEYYNGSALLGSAASSPYSYTWSNVPAGTYSLTAKVIDTLGGTAVSTPVAVTVTATSLPAPWLTTDIGSVGVAGSAGYLGGVFSVSGAGEDIWGTADGFRYVYQPLAGNGEIVARVSSQQNTNTWAKAGVMIRETLAVGSSHALMAITPLNGAAFQRRLTTSALSLHTQGPYIGAPYWVKLVRSGAVFSGYISNDGVTWTLVGSDTIAMANNLYVGLAVTSHDTTVASAVVMDNVTYSPGPQALISVRDTPPRR